MLRDWDLSEISDGKLYSSGDMAKLGCGDCRGCSTCCRVVGDSIVLDPYDLFSLSTGLNKPAQVLLAESLELGVVDGLILPHLKMRNTGDGSEACIFLGDDGRCKIHAHRPGFCRMFPLGRLYSEDGFSYFLQIHECVSAIPRTKVKIRSWIGIEPIGEYEAFVFDWHTFLKGYTDAYQNGEYTDDAWKALNMRILQTFFLADYDGERDFYEQYRERKQNVAS